MSEIFICLAAFLVGRLLFFYFWSLALHYHTSCTWKFEKLSHCSENHKKVKKEDESGSISALLYLSNPLATPRKAQARWLPGAGLGSPAAVLAQLQGCDCCHEYKQPLLQRRLLLWRKEKTHMVFGSDFFYNQMSRLRLLFLIVSFVTDVQDDFLSTFDRPDRMKYNLISFMAIQTGENNVPYLFSLVRSATLQLFSLPYLLHAGTKIFSDIDGCRCCRATLWWSRLWLL